MRLLLAFGAAVLVLLVVFFVALRAVGGGGDSVDCSGFRLTPGRWQSTKPDDRSELQIKISMCRALQGKRAPASVQALLGPPDAAPPPARSRSLSYRFGPTDVRLHAGAPARREACFEVGRLTKSGPQPA